MAREALNTRVPRGPFEDIYLQREDNPSLFAALKEAAFFEEIPRTFDSVTMPLVPELHPFLVGKASIASLAIGGKGKEQLLGELAPFFRINDFARSAVEQSLDSADLPQPTRQIDVVKVNVGDLEINENYPGTKRRDARAMELGLKVQTVEDFLYWILVYGSKLNQGERVYSSMRPIIYLPDEIPVVLFVENRYDGLEICCETWKDEWNPDDQVAFNLRAPAGEASNLNS